MTQTDPALVRGMEMLKIPMGQLPEPALLYAAYLNSKVGLCLEVLLTAWTTYAQIVEGLPCEDELYKVDDDIKADWEYAQANFVRLPNADGKAFVVHRDTLPE